MAIARVIGTKPVAVGVPQRTDGARRLRVQGSIVLSSADDGTLAILQTVI
jgi:hypothetical protein